MIYFTRYGRADFGDGTLTEKGISDEGRKELGLIKLKLSNFDFNPQVVVSSKALRCIQTACLLGGVREEQCHIVKELGITGSFYGLVGDVDIILNPVISIISSGLDAVVACHDSTATVLALRFIEKTGKRIDWNNIPRELMFLRQSHGLLVGENDYIYLSP